MGGLDLFFGRWDTHTHPLADVHPTDFLDSARIPWHEVSYNPFVSLL